MVQYHIDVNLQFAYGRLVKEGSQRQCNHSKFDIICFLNDITEEPHSYLTCSCYIVHCTEKYMWKYILFTLKEGRYLIAKLAQRAVQRHNNNGNNNNNKHFKYKVTVVYCAFVNLIGYIIVLYLLIVNSYASLYIMRHVWTWCNIIKQFFSTCYLTFLSFHAMRLR